VGSSENREEEINDFQEAEELNDDSESSQQQDKLMRSVIEEDSMIKDGHLIDEATNQSLGAFIPEMIFSKISQNFNQAKELYGEKMITEVTGFASEYVEKNAKIPEFQTEIKKNITERIKRLKKNKLIDEDGIITDQGFKMSSLLMYTEELDKMQAQGLLGEKQTKEKSHYGGRNESDNYKKGDRFVDIDIRKTIKNTIKRGHDQIHSEDLKIFEREAKGNVEIIYAIDASGSMKGRKIEVSKRAGVALAYKAIENQDKVGLMVFGADVTAKIEPCVNFMEIVDKLSRITASKETNFNSAIEESFQLFSNRDVTKHLIFLTDGVPTSGEEPEKEALEAIAHANAAGITCSMIGIKLDGQAEEFLRKATELGGGKFYNVKDLNKLDAIVLEDYELSND
jgi:Mg-chelatase subunit ChlD